MILGDTASVHEYCMPIHKVRQSKYVKLCISIAFKKYQNNYYIFLEIIRNRKTNMKNNQPLLQCIAILVPLYFFICIKTY